MRIKDIKVNHLSEPLGYALGTPVFTFETEPAGDAAGIKSGSLFIRDDQVPPEVVYESGELADISSLGIAAEGIALKPRTCYYADLNIESGDGMLLLAATKLETGKMDEPWQGVWISPRSSAASAVLRKKFYISDTWRGRLYICGLDAYECHINGQRVGNEYLASGYPAIDGRLQIQTYDVESCLVEGENEIMVTLGRCWTQGEVVANGWDCTQGQAGADGRNDSLCGGCLRLIAELYTADGLAVKTDDTWEELPCDVTFSGAFGGEAGDTAKAAGEELSCSAASSDILSGEVSDPAKAAGKILGYAAISGPAVGGALFDRRCLPVKKQCAFPVKDWAVTPRGETVLDFGEKVKGWVEFNGQMVPAGLTVKLTAGILTEDGEFWADSCQCGRSEFVFISNGAARRIRPRFSIYSFSAMKLELLKGEEHLDPDSFLRAEDFKAWQIS